jgi:hypothetical protein
VSIGQRLIDRHLKEPLKMSKVIIKLEDGMITEVIREPNVEVSVHDYDSVDDFSRNHNLVQKDQFEKEFVEVIL